MRNSADEERMKHEKKEPKRRSNIFAGNDGGMLFAVFFVVCHYSV